MKVGIAIIVSLVLLSLGGCANYGVSANRYTDAHMMHSAKTVPATIVALRRVEVVNAHNDLGTVIGGTAGGIAGNAIGAGHGNMLATLAGAVIGGLAGSTVENRVAGHRQALQITVKGPQGQYHTVVQPDDGTHYHVHEKVLVVQQGYNGYTRIEPMGTTAL
ncbi:MAG TPA: glycine zipper 2TM domain-containing protein [Gammaproteobacteria bacterium]|nr:glycine zipper 2TM domain-containing protein [Gammaproteobacteria bacterium]